MHPAIDRALASAADWLAGAGYAVEEVEPPPITEPARSWFQVAVAEMKVMLFPVAAEHGSRTIQEIFSNYERMEGIVDAAGYMRGIAERTRMTRAWSVFSRHLPAGADAVSHAADVPMGLRRARFEQTRELFAAGIYSHGINYLGFPVGVAPVGLIEGLPAAVQIVGRRFREDLILDAMEAVESHVGVPARSLWARET